MAVKSNLSTLTLSFFVRYVLFENRFENLCTNSRVESFEMCFEAIRSLEFRMEY